MSNRNWNVSTEIEPRVPRHPTPALTETVPTVPEVSLAFDTPPQRIYHTNEPRTPTISTTYAQWKQQVPQRPISINSGALQKLSRSNSSSESPRNHNTALATIEKPQNQGFTKDSRLKFYQKLSSGPSSAINPSTPPRRLQRSLSLGSQPQEITPSDLVLKQKHQLSLNPQEQLKTCDYHSHQVENTEIINKLLSLVQSQNAQIQMLQGQVETLLSMRAERPRELNHRLPLGHQHVSTSTNSPRKIQEFEEKQKDEICKHVIKEKKVSIGVMTSFELTVQDSVVYNVETASAEDHQDKSLHSVGNKTRTPVSGGKVLGGPLEQIVEDSESHLSSGIQGSNNFHTCSSVRKSLQGNFQGDLENCVELPEINRSIVDQNQFNNLGNDDNGSMNQQKRSSVPQEDVRPNSRRDLVDKEAEITKKTPKVGWTLYDNVMCQVNEILHNSQEDGDQGNQSKLVRSGIQQSVEQLKVFGFTFAENSGCSGGRSLVDNRRMAPIPIDASYYPRLDYQANVVQNSCSASDSNTSLHMKALAMKYLGSKGLGNVSGQRGMEIFSNMVLSNIQGNGAGGSVHDVSKIDKDHRFQGSPKALPDAQRGNYLMHSKPSPPNGHNPHNILDISSLKRQPKLL